MNTHPHTPGPSSPPARADLDAETREAAALEQQNLWIDSPSETAAMTEMPSSVTPETPAARPH